MTASTPPASASLLACHYFAASCSAGELGLAAPAREGTPRDAVAAALSLAACEPLLVALERWLGEPVDPVPVEPPATRTPKGDLCVEVMDAELAVRGARLRLPWALLKSRPRPDFFAGLRWPRLQFEAQVGAFDSNPLPDDADASEGGALLLRESFGAAWKIALVDRFHALGWSALWQGPGTDGIAAGLPTPVMPPNPAWRVVLEEPVEALIGEVLGWPVDAAPAGSEPSPASAASVISADERAVKLACPSRYARLLSPGHTKPVVRGMILPMMQGFGIAWGKDIAAQIGRPDVQADVRA